MKLFKSFLTLVFVSLLFMTACTNNEPLIEEPQTQESESITTSLNRLGQEYDEDGNLIMTLNSTGNLVFDFCFEFVYPLNLSYNNGSTVSVNSVEELVVIIINSSPELFINGIAFPFDVETYNESTNAIEVSTINNEDEFINLIENCSFDNNDPCNCTNIYDPVCVEILDAAGESLIIEYSNSCFASCDGFNENDFVECEDDGCIYTYEYNPVCVEVIYSNGESEIITFSNESMAICEGYNENDFIDCVNTNDCSEENIENIITECTWIVYNSSTNHSYVFNPNGIVVLTHNNYTENGPWNITTDPSTGEITLTIMQNGSNYYDEWVFDCSSNELIANSTIFSNIEIEMNCD